MRRFLAALALPMFACQSAPTPIVSSIPVPVKEVHASAPPSPPPEAPPPEPAFKIDLTPRKTVAKKVRPNAITIDGNLDEPEWQRAPLASGFVLASTNVAVNGRTPREPTVVRALWDDTYLYIGFTTVDDEVIAKDFKLWTQDAVEIFIDASDGHKSYVQFGTNPRDTKMSFAYSAPHVPVSGWDSHMKVGVREVANGWSAEFAIPLESVKGNAKTMQNVPPKIGTHWRINFCRQDSANGKEHETSTWAPTSAGDIHSLELFGTLEFGG